MSSIPTGGQRLTTQQQHYMLKYPVGRHQHYDRCMRLRFLRGVGCSTLLQAGVLFLHLHPGGPGAVVHHDRHL